VPARSFSSVAISLMTFYSSFGHFHFLKTSDIFTQQQKVGLLPFALFTHVVLQIAALIELHRNQIVTLAAIPQ
jgi:hypothetical protein